MRTFKSFKILEHGSQRNGVGGDPFYYFKLQWRDEGENMNTLHEGIATLTLSFGRDEEHPEKFNGSCRVVTPDNLDAHWRGDVFEDEIRKRHAEWYQL